VHQPPRLGAAITPKIRLELMERNAGENS